MSKKIIIVEGADGTGKSTFIKNNFSENEWEIIHLPGYFSYNKEFYELFKQGKLKDYQYTFQIMAEHFQVLYEIYKKEKDVVLDRSFISFLVYQQEEINYFNFNFIYDKFIEMLNSFLVNEWEVKIYYFDKIYKKKGEDWIEKNQEIDRLMNIYNSLLYELKLLYRETNYNLEIYVNNKKIF